MRQTEMICEMEGCLGDAILGNLCFNHAYQQGKIEFEDRTNVSERVKRHPVSYRWDGLNWNFLKLMAEIAQYAASKYGSPEQYTNGRLDGDRSPLNHIAEHLRAYIVRETHDKFGDLDHQLAAIAYNAMMEFYYLHHGGPTAPEVFYTRGAE